MKKTFLASLAAAALAITSSLRLTHRRTHTVGGAAMYPTKTIVENAVNSPIHTTLVAAVKAAGLVDTLNCAGPFTVFAPTNDAFAKLPAGTVDTLVKPENKATLDQDPHLPRRRRQDQLQRDRGDDQGGRRQVHAQDRPGRRLTATMSGGKIMLTDAKGGMATITTADVFQSNGVIHVIDTVLMPS